MVLAKQSKSPVHVTEFKNFRRIEYKGLSFFLAKSKSNSKSVIINKGINTLNLRTISKDSNIMNFELYKNNKKFIVYLKKENNRFYSSIFPLKKYVENLDSTLLCLPYNYETALARIKDSDFISKIRSLATQPFLDEQECEKADILENEKDKLNKEIISFLNPEKSTSSILKCFEDAKVIEIFKSNPAQLNNVLKILNSYIKKTDNLTDKSFKFSCYDKSLDSQNKSPSASTTSDGSKAKIVFNFKDGKLVSDVCKTTEQIIFHEFAHVAGVAEQEVEQLDALCAESITGKATPIHCKTSQSTSFSDKGSNRIIANQLIANAAQTIDQERLPYIQESFQAAIKPEDFKPISPENLNTLSTAPADSPAFSRAIETAYKSASDNFVAIAEPFNAVVAASVAPAVAGTSLASSESPMTRSQSPARFPSSSTTSTSKVPQKVEAYPLPEAIYDNVTFGDAKAPSFKDSGIPITPLDFSTGNNPTRGQNTKLPGSDDTENQSNTNISATSHTEQKTETSDEDNDLPLTTPTQSAAPTRTTASSASPTISTSSNNGSSTISSGSLTLPLSSMEMISGNQYNSIRQNYQNQSFIRELQAKKITIQIGNQFIGSTPSQARSVFVDTGSSLTKKQSGK